MLRTARSLLALATIFVAGAPLLHCSSNDDSSGIQCSSIQPDASFTLEAGVCYPDNDGITGGSYTIELDVDDTGFLATAEDAGTKNIIATQNDAQVTLTLTNTGTKPHGFEVLCTNVCASYPTLPVGCSPVACFPAAATIAPIQPGTSTTVTFNTPTPDGLLYPFQSTAPGDATVAGLNNGQWSLM